MAAAGMAVGGASEAATMVASGTAPDVAGTAAVGGPMASALAGGRPLWATFGYAAERSNSLLMHRASLRYAWCD